MDREFDDLVDRLRQIEDELEQRIDARRVAFQYELSRNRVIFEESVIAQHRRLRAGLFRFLRTSPVMAVATAPLVYTLVVPIALLDLGVCLFQLVCFPIWGIAAVRRADFIVIDRRFLAYLNAVQKLNCIYCSYANGVIALVREVASRTEQFWCPIKHASRIKGAHDRYRQFLDYGDADGFRDRLDGYRDRVRTIRDE